MAISITGLSVFYYDDQGAPQEIGTHAPVAPGSEADAICKQFVKKLIYRRFDEKTRLHRFTTGPDGQVVCPVYSQLVALRTAANMQGDALTVARHLARWGWLRRYVLLFISFTRDGAPMLALIMAGSATGETFSLSPRRLVTELRRIFKRDVEKGVLFPYYIPGVGATPDTSRVTLIQLNNTAGYLTAALSVEPAPTAAELYLPRIEAAIAQGHRGKGILRAILAGLQPETPPVSPAALKLELDLGGMQVKATMADLDSGRLQIARLGDRWQITLTASAETVKAKVAGELAPVELLQEHEEATGA